MRRNLAILFEGLGVICGGLAGGAAVMVYLNLRDYDDGMWGWLAIIAVLLTLLSLTFIALGLTLHEPKNMMREVPHGIAVGRSGAPEMTDPMPSPARVIRPVSGAYDPEKRTLSRSKG